MTNEASQLMAEALRVAKLDGSFSPAELGAKIGLRKPQAEAAARELSNAGVLILGFDFSASFSPDYRRFRAKAETRTETKADRKAETKVDRKPERRTDGKPSPTDLDRPAAGRKLRAVAGRARRD